MAVHNLCNRTVEVVVCDVNDEEWGNRQAYDSVVPHQEMQDYAVLGDSNSLSAVTNNLPPYIKDIFNNVRKLEICLNWFLHIHIFNINLSQADNVPLNIFNRTIYLTYSLNNLCSLSPSLTKKKS